MQRLMRANQRARAPIDEPFFNYSSRFYRANFHSPLFSHIFDKLSRALIPQFVVLLLFLANPQMKFAKL